MEISKFLAKLIIFIFFICKEKAFMTDSNPVNFNTTTSSANSIYNNTQNTPNYYQFDPVANNLTNVKGYETLPREVQTVLEATGVFSLTPANGWTKTILTSDTLKSAFQGSTIYTPPPDTIGFFNKLRIEESNKTRFDDFLSTLFDLPVEETQQDSYQSSGNSNDSSYLMSLLNPDNYK
jgi:hypothetical protein